MTKIIAEQKIIEDGKKIKQKLVISEETNEKVYEILITKKKGIRIKYKKQRDWLRLVSFIISLSSFIVSLIRIIAYFIE